MPIIKMVNGKLTVNNRPAKWCQWTLTVADLDPSAEKSTRLAIPSALGGLPAGHEVTSEEQLFKTFQVPVRAETELRTPNGKTSKLRVNFTAKRADDFTGPGLRIREAKSEAGEINELQKAQVLVKNILDELKKDRASRVDDIEKKKQREKLAVALRALAAAL